MHHYPFHLGDYAKDTAGLSQGQHGSYRLLMDSYYATEEGIPVDEIYAISKATTPEERRATDKVIKKYFVLRRGRYHQKRIEEEIAIYRAKSKKAAESANKRWEKPLEEPSGEMRKHMPTHSDGNAKAMLASSQQPVTSNQRQQLGGRRLSVTDWRLTPSDMEAAGRLRSDLDLHNTERKLREFYAEKRITKNAHNWSKAWLEWVAGERGDNNTKGNDDNKGNGALSNAEIEAVAKALDISTVGKSREQCLQLIRRCEDERERDAQ